MPKKIETIVYEYDELSEKAKSRARQWFIQSNDFEFEWDCIKDDAKTIGLKLTAWDYGRYVKGEFSESPIDVAEAITREHGAVCETYKTAAQFIADRAALIADFQEGEELEDKTEYDDLCAEFIKSLLEDYRIMCDSQYDYINSDEYVEENIRANEYTFTESGARFG